MMTTTEFWELYTTKNILEIFDETCAFFSEDLPEGFMDEYDVEEILIETRGHQESAKNFDNVLRFTAIVRENHPDLYLEVFEYFDDFLVDYYCYHGEEDELKEAFANFQAFPLQSIDQYLLAFNKLVYYQHTGILQEAVSENFNEINEWEDSFGNPEFDLASFVYCETLEKLHLDQPDEFDRDEFSNKLSKFNYEFKSSILDSIEKGLFNPPLEPDVLKDLFQQEKRKALHLIEVYFLRHMYEKGFKFYLSSGIWNHISRYWIKENDHDDTSSYSYFGHTASGFVEYLFRDISNSMYDKSAEIIEALWGSVYVYEFLNQLELISKETFVHFLETSRKMKGLVIGRKSIHLWNANFVHHWEKPDCVPETEFREEEKIFRKSINISILDSLKLLEHIPEELANIGPLSDDIQAGIEANNRRLNRIQKNISGDNTIYRLPGDKPFLRTEKKVGRNEPCPCGSGKKYKKCCGKHS